MATRVIGKNADFGISAAAQTTDPPFAFTAAGIVLFEVRSNDFTLNIDVNVEQSEAYGDDWKTEEIIDAAWNADVAAYYSNVEAPSIDTLLLDLTLLFSKRALNFYPNGRNVTMSTLQPRYSGRGIIVGSGIAAPRGGLTGVRLRIQGDGLIVKTTTGSDT